MGGFLKTVVAVAVLVGWGRSLVLHFHGHGTSNAIKKPIGREVGKREEKESRRIPVGLGFGGVSKKIRVCFI